MKVTNYRLSALSIAFFGLALCTTACNQDDKQTVTTKFNLVLEDNFDGIKQKLINGII